MPAGSGGDDDKKKAKKSNLYTKTGDKGVSSLYNLERKPKTDAVFQVRTRLGRMHTTSC